MEKPELSGRQQRKLAEVYETTPPSIRDQIGKLELPETAKEIAIEAFQGRGRTRISFMHGYWPRGVKEVYDRDFTGKSFDELVDAGMARIETKSYNWLVWYGRNHWLVLNETPSDSGPAPLQCVAYFANELGLLPDLSQKAVGYKMALQP